VTTHDDQRGFAVLEWTLGIGLIVLPVAVLVASLAPWFHQASMARTMAQEAARVLVLSDDWEAGTEAATAMARQIARNHGVEDDGWCAGGSGCVSVAFAGTLGRADEVTATVSVPMQGITVPFIGSALGFQWSTAHSERVDDYRSFDP
jgi:hypothetical protein